MKPVKHFIGILGGTFDPVHCGHLRVALDIQQALQLDEMRLIPCRQSPLREAPVARPGQRVEMLRLAIDGNVRPPFRLDERELFRQGPSYTVDTLSELRRENPEAALGFVIGLDAMLSFNQWHEWRRILELAHLLVAARPGWYAGHMNGSAVDAFADEEFGGGELAQLWRERYAPSPDVLREATAGRIYACEVTQLDISATRIRELRARGLSPRYLLPDSVLNYIDEVGLYL